MSKHEPVFEEPKVAFDSSTSRLDATSTDQAMLRRFLCANGVKLVTALLAC